VRKDSANEWPVGHSVITSEEEQIDDPIEHVLHLEDCEEEGQWGLVVDSFWNVPSFDCA
jgi:hypothetical protein